MVFVVISLVLVLCLVLILFLGIKTYRLERQLASLSTNVTDSFDAQQDVNRSIVGQYIVNIEHLEKR